MPAVVLVDAEGAIQTWLATQNIPAALKPRRSGPAYILLSRVGGIPDATAGVDHPRISGIAHAKTKQDALNLAVQFANAVWNIPAGTVLTAGVLCQDATVDSGPSELADSSGESRYNVETSWSVGAF